MKTRFSPVESEFRNVASELRSVWAGFFRAVRGFRRLRESGFSGAETVFAAIGTRFLQVADVQPHGAKGWRFVRGELRLVRAERAEAHAPRTQLIVG